MWKNRLVLVIDELNNNAIEYWSKPWDKNKIIFKISNTKKYFLFNIEVYDSGLGKLTKTADEMEIIRNKKKEAWFNKYKSIRGRGLFLIIEKLVDKLYFKDWENWELIVWIEKKIEKS
jgi:anti-sigma regulatory factor (Ser/Thr protein kinase)